MQHNCNHSNAELCVNRGINVPCACPCHRRRIRAALDLDPQTKFAATGKAVMQGGDCRAVATSHTFARRIANALNKYTPGEKGY